MKVLDGSLGFLLARAARSMKRALEARLSAYNITATQYIVLSVLDEEDDISLSQLGQQLSFDNPTLTGIIDRMERDELVERRRTPDDRRVINVLLTDKGRKLFQDISQHASDVNDEALESLTLEQREALIESLDKIWMKMNGKTVR